MFIITKESIKFTEEEKQTIENFYWLIDDLYEVTEDDEIEEICVKIKDGIEALLKEKEEK